jgi:adenine-specific DNA-methyltransferase
MSQKFEKLKTLLLELFQLDKPDLDFGIYRVMHAKSAEVSQFLDKDLLPQVNATFSQYHTADKAEIEKELAKAIEQAQALGADPETLPKVKDLRARLANEAVDIGALESEVYDHLYSFFRRYYDQGDFLAKRVYKPGVYAIPYEGEEVTLHWANKDQYYIKTSEYLSDYAFRLRPDDDQQPMRVHFRLADAVEGEHGNVKAAEGQSRVFILVAPGVSGHDFMIEEDGEEGKELAIRFQYRPATLTDWPDDERDGKKKPPVQKELIALATRRVLDIDDEALVSWIAELGKPHVMAAGQKADYTKLEAHLRRYTTRNTFDYFIHKDLSTFLRRELDFYIKNEVMHLDDVENETAPRVEQYLSKIRVIRKIAGKIIDFLAQLEDFQKKLWLKKKLVVETTWCITVGCIPEDFYTEICANEAQQEEWVELFAIDEIKGDLTTPGYSSKLTPEFLKAHPTLVVDTQHFEAGFKSRLLEAIGDLDTQTDGVLFHGENFQALNLVQASYREKVKCIYIDPPYNTGKDGFPYKDSYQHSSWASMIVERLALARTILKKSGALFISIDENEQSLLRGLCDSDWGVENHLADFVWLTEGNFDNQAKVKIGHEYVLSYAKDERRFPHPPIVDPSISKESKLYNDTIRNTIVKNGPKNPVSKLLLPIGFPADFEEGVILPGASEWPKYDDIIVVSEHKLVQAVFAESGWSSKAMCDEYINNGMRPVKDSKGQQTEFVLTRTGAIESIKERSSNQGYVTSIIRSTGTVQATSAMLVHLGTPFSSFPKPVGLIKYLVSMVSNDSFRTMDFFAGSGTTAHAIITLNREDGGRRRFDLVEVGDYFQTVLLPRIKKVTFSPEWKDGKPKRFATSEEAERSPRIIKVVRLESYEDALNNLETSRTKEQQGLLDLAEAQGAEGLKEQYILRYMLDVETRGSQSLLNVQAFTDPTAYKLLVKRPGSDESRVVNVDLLETFNWLIGLTVKTIAAPQTFSAAFERDGEDRLRLKGRLKQEAEGPFWFRTITGTTPDGRRTLIIWRKLTGEPEQDNLTLDEWFTKQGYSAKDSEFDLIYVNGGNNLENLKTADDLWKVRLIEEDFHRLMFEAEAA